ncbi:hypothetical protein D3C71_1068780 [compost metagenome]
MHGVRGVGRIAGQCVRLRQVVDGGAIEHVAAKRFIAQAQFKLRAFGGFEGVARPVHPHGGRERLAGACIGRQAVVRQVDQADAPRRRGIAQARGGAGGVALLVGIGPILAAAQHKHPFVLDLDLVLQVQPQRTAARIDPVIGSGIHDGNRAVDGVVDVRQRRHRARMTVRIVAAAVVVQAGQHRVLEGSCVQLQLQRRIGGNAVGMLVAADDAATQGLAVGLQGAEAQVVPLAIRGEIAGALAQLHAIVEGVFELVADRVGVGVVAVEIGLADEQVARHLAVQGIGRGHRRGKARANALIAGQQGERRGRRGLPRQGGRQIRAVVRHMVHPVVGVAGKAGQAVGPCTILRQLAGEIARHLAAAIAAALHVQFAQRVGRWPLADGIDHATRAQLPIQHR